MHSIKKKILVTGANGQLGLTFKDLQQNYPELQMVFVSKETLDITHKTSIERFIKNQHFDFCINCAAYTNVEQAEKTPEPAYQVNAEGVKYLAEVCKENDIHLIHISTDYVFDGEKKALYTIDDEPNPINEYGTSKLQGEQNIQAVLNNYTIIRTSWLYSKIHGHNFYKTILEKAKTEVELYITHEQIGCPTNTVTLGKYILQNIIQSDLKKGLLHFSDNEPMTWYDFAKKIVLENQLNAKVVARKYTTFAARPINSVI